MSNSLITHKNFLQYTLVIASLAPNFCRAEQSLPQAIEDQLRYSGSICRVLLGGDDLSVLTGGLNTICTQGTAPAGEASTSASGANSGNAQSLAFKKGQAFKDESQIASQIYGPWSLFINTEVGILNRSASFLESAYDSTIQQFNLGATYSINAKTSLGFTGGQSISEGDFTQGGNFKTTGNNLRLIGDFALTDTVFSQVLVGATRTNSANQRLMSLDDDFEGGRSIKAKINSDYNYTQRELAVLLGKYWNIGSVTFSPHISLYSETADFGTYAEQGNSGLEVTIHDDKRQQLQGSLNLQLSQSNNMSWGVLMPTVNVAWIEEFADEARTVQLSFTGDTRAKRFTYNIDEGDRYKISLAVDCVLIAKKGWQLALGVESYFAYDYFERTTARGSVRWEL